MSGLVLGVAPGLEPTELVRTLHGAVRDGLAEAGVAVRRADLLRPAPGTGRMGVVRYELVGAGGVRHAMRLVTADRVSAALSTSTGEVLLVDPSDPASARGGAASVGARTALSPTGTAARGGRSMLSNATLLALVDPSNPLGRLAESDPEFPYALSSRFELLLDGSERVSEEEGSALLALSRDLAAGTPLAWVLRRAEALASPP